MKPIDSLSVRINLNELTLNKFHKVQIWELIYFISDVTF